MATKKKELVDYENKPENIIKMEYILRSQFRQHPQLNKTTTQHILHVLYDTGVTSRNIMKIRLFSGFTCERQLAQAIRSRAKQKKHEQNPNQYAQSWKKRQMGLDKALKTLQSKKD